MESNEISIQECRVFQALRGTREWMSNAEISDFARVAPRTVRAKTRKFVDLGLCDLAEVFPGHRYRLSQKADKRNLSYLKRLEDAVTVFGLHFI